MTKPDSEPQHDSGSHSKHRIEHKHPIMDVVTPPLRPDRSIGSSALRPVINPTFMSIHADGKVEMPPDIGLTVYRGNSPASVDEDPSLQALALNFPPK